MKCPRCQQENPPLAKFCLECATPLALRCASCNTQLPAGAKFCFECATPVTGVASAPRLTSPPRVPSPEAYTPRHLAERIINSKASLEGERKQVTVLFADLKGSMELLADRDPEEARRLLDPVIEHMMEAVHRFEGTVNQVMGDGIMALFGAPLAHEDHAIRACYAALRMQESVRRYAEGIFRSYGVPVEIRVGVNSGEVVVRSIGSDLHMDYTAVGQTTHLAARMEQTARPGTILLTPETLALAEGFVQVGSLGRVAVKGLSAPLEVFELTGANPVRSRLHAAASRGLTRFVGRDVELDLLRQALARAEQGHGQIVAIVGEPGVGKSRLAWEFTHSHRSQDWLVLEAGAVSYGRATTYYPVSELLRRYFQIEPRDDGRRRREKITGKLLSLDRALEPTLPVFLSLLEVPVDETGWATLDPASRRRQTLDGLKRLLVRETRVQPVLAVFEDLHWIDSETQALLDTLVESVPTARLLLLVNYRPEYAHGWGSKTYYQQIRLDALHEANVGSLLEALLGSDRSLAGLQRLLIDRTQGNPFFLEETVQALVETGALTGERGAYRLAGPLQSLHVPATVQTILSSRIDRLAPEDKRLLQTAAVVGKDVPLALLHAIAEQPEEALRHGLLQLLEGEFLYETQLFPEPEYTFKHALTHEAAYGSLLKERRQALHARIVEALEARHAGRLDDQVERLADHAERGGLWGKAAAYRRLSGNKAAGRSAYREAVAHYEGALAALGRVPSTRENIQERIDLRVGLREVLFALGEPDRALEHLNEAEALAEAAADHERLARILCFRGMIDWARGDYQPVLAMSERVRAMTETKNVLSVEAPTRDVLGRTYYNLGDFSRAVEVLTENVIALRDHPRERFGLAGFVSVLSLSFLGMSNGELGAFAEGYEWARQARRIAEEADHPHSLVSAYACEGRLALQQGDLHAATQALERALAICESWNIGVWRPVLGGALAHAYALQGRRPQEMERLEQFALQRSPAEAERLLRLATVYFLTGRPLEALDLAERVLELAGTRKERGNEASVSFLLAELASHRPGEIAAAAVKYQTALSLSERLGMRPLAAHCHAALARLYRRDGRPEAARTELTIATELYREMDMRFWLEKAAAETGRAPKGQFGGLPP